MTIRKVSYLQGTVAAPYKLPAEDHRLNHAGLWVPSSALGKLKVRSGILPGPGNPGAVTVVAGGVNVNPFHAVIQGTLSETQGVYEFASDAVEFRAITAASSTEFRRGYVIARVYDQLNPGTGTVQDLPALEVIYGPNAATAGAATLPPLPANSTVLKEFAVSSAGVITLVNNSGPTWVVTRGGIQPVDAADAALPAYDGQYRDHPTAGLQRGVAGAWTGQGTGLDAPVMRLFRTAALSVVTGFTDNFTWDNRTDPTNMAEGTGPTWTFVTVARAGWYQVNLGIDFLTVGTYRMGIILQTVGKPVSTGTEALIGRLGVHAGTGGDQGVSASDVLPFTAGQRLRCGVFQDSGANAQIGAQFAYATNYWSMAWLRPL